jgi:hypothetical protein
LVTGLSTKLGTPVSIRAKKHGGQIIIPFKNRQDLDQISQKLAI